MIVNKFGLSVNRNLLLSKLFKGIKNKEIEFYRQQNRAAIYNLLKEQLASTKEHIIAKNPNMRLEFVSKFLLY
jgi:hypothetical protein